MQFFTVEYPGFRVGFPGRVAYVVHGRDVYFTSLTGPHEATSTINAAEAVIVAICKVGEVHWRSGRFFDVQTHRGYERYPVGSYQISRLVVTGDVTPVVTEWIPVAMSDDFIAAGEGGIRHRDELPGIPAEVSALLREYIEG